MNRLLLDRDGEEFVFENGWDTAIPFAFTHTADGTTVTVFPKIEPIGEEFLSRFGEDPTSDAALAWLFSAMAPYWKEWGYADDRFRDRWGYILRRSDAEKPIENNVMSPVLLKSVDEDRNDTTYDLEATCDAGCLAYGIVEDGRVVSLAVTHDPIGEDDAGAAEVGVETVPRARRKGYASACLRALAEDLEKRGISPEYRVQRYNRASRRTAHAAGFREIGTFYYYVGRRVN